MQRKEFIGSGLLAAGGLLTRARQLHAAVPKMKITRIRAYQPPEHIHPDPSFLTIIVMETDQGVTGIGEGGTKETLESLGSLLIGQDPSRIQHLQQLMWRGDFYPPGREKLRALSALDLAMWDIKGKALGVPVYELLGGLARDYCECYTTSFPTEGFKNLGEIAHEAMELGFQCFRTYATSRGERFGDDAGDHRPFDAKQILNETYQNCKEIYDVVGPGRWCVDYHTRLDPTEAVRLCTMLEPLAPYFTEDLIRSEYAGAYRSLRQQVRVPIAVGEQFGARWDMNELVEQQLVDYLRVFPPNCGGLTEFVKIAAMCETHFVGLIPHLAGPVSEAAIAHCCFTFPGTVMMEISGRGPTASTFPHLPAHYDFRQGKVWPNSRPGLGVEFDPKGLPMVADIRVARQPVGIFRRPDGSWLNN